MNKFESVLLKYGAKILIDIRVLAEGLEKYEDCAKINKVLEKYDIKTTFDTGDWRNEFWERGSSGETATSNMSEYYYKAVKLVYGKDIVDLIVEENNNIKFSKL